MDVAVSQHNIIFRKNTSKHVALFFLNVKLADCNIDLYKQCMWKIPTLKQACTISFLFYFFYGELSLEQ
jgi:hypothetical protein